MPHIRLLVSVAGSGPVTGASGDVLRVDADTARVWADGVRAELVREEPRERAIRRPTELAGRRRDGSH